MKTRLYLLSFLLLSSCSTSQKDPLANSKKLIKEGHVSLYKNGAFEVPGTTLTLIPPGPSTYDLAKELTGVRAKAAFQLSLKRARESVYVVKEGSKWSYKKGKEVSGGTDNVIHAIRSFSRPGARVIIDKSSALAVGLIGSSWEASKKVKENLKALALEIEEQSKNSSKENMASFGALREEIHKETKELSEATQAETQKASKATAHFAYESFVLGNLSIPKNLKANFQNVVESPTLHEFVSDFKSTSEDREHYSSKMTYLISDTIQDYSKNVKASFEKGNNEFKNHSDEYGYSFATLRALRYYLQGIFWNGLIEPTGKITGGALGYVTVNTVAYPVMLVASEGKNIAELAVEVTFNTGKSAYDITAPTLMGAVAGALSVASSGGGKVASLSIKGAGAVTEGVVAGAQYTTSALIAGGGQLAATGTRYVGVPLAMAGVTTAGTLSGVAVGTGGLVTGGGTYVGGEALQAGSYAVGKSAAAGTVIVGSTVSLATGAVVSVYEVGEAVVVPSAYTLGAGVVVSYGTLTHVSAQALLAVSDASYVVLSMEGPRWVLYAVSGKLGKDTDPVPGTLLDLEKMKKNGETIYKVPVSDEEIKEMTKGMQL